MLRRFSVLFGLLLCIPLLMGVTVVTRLKGLGFTPLACGGGGYIVPFDADIQALINRLGAGASLCFQGGVYRVRAQRTTPLTPVAGQTYNCSVPRSCVLTGAMTITGWAQLGTHLYMASGFLPPSNYGGGVCNSGTLCTQVNDVFSDGTWLPPVANTASLATGRVYLDYVNNYIFLYDNPSGHVIEQSGLSAMFQALTAINNVTMRGLVIDKVASPAQNGAIDAFRDYNITGWTLDNIEVRWAHGAGVELRNGTIQNGFLHDNGQEGYVTRGTGSFFNNEVSNNNFAGFSPGWEAGGGKVVFSNGYLFTYNNVHDNGGPGIWFDIFDYNSIITHNTVSGIYPTGIEIEIGNTADIEFNTVKTTTTTAAPGQGGDGCFSNGAIWVYLTPHVVVANNTTTSSVSNGICVDAQISVRDCSYTESGGPTVTSYPNGDLICPIISIRPTPQPEALDVNVHDNKVYITSLQQSSHYARFGGWATSDNAAWFTDPANGNIRWSNNTWCGPDYPNQATGFAVFGANFGYGDPAQYTHNLDGGQWKGSWEPSAVLNTPAWPGCIPP